MRGWGVWVQGQGWRGLTLKGFICGVSAVKYSQERGRRRECRSTLPLLPLRRPLPFFHLCTLSATGPSEFPRARGSPLSVSSDTVIRSVGTESIPRS